MWIGNYVKFISGCTHDKVDKWNQLHLRKWIILKKIDTFNKKKNNTVF